MRPLTLFGRAKLQFVFSKTVRRYNNNLNYASKNLKLNGRITILQKIEFTNEVCR
jgi:hypothetical protein